MDPVVLEKAYAELESIFRAWVKNEDMDELREALGVNPPSGRRRTTRHVQGERKIVEAMIDAARKGHNVSSYRKAADVLDSDEKQIERAWREWGEQLTLGMRLNEAARNGKVDVLRAYFVSQAADATEHVPHMAPLFNDPEQIEARIAMTLRKAIEFPSDAATLTLLPPLSDIK